MKKLNKIILTTCGAFLATTNVMAEEITDVRNPSKYDITNNNWDLILGIATGVKPEYIGSDDSEAFVLPFVIAKYQFDEKNSAYFGPSEGIGYKYKADKRLSMGLGITYRGGRDSSDDSYLSGMADVDGAPEIGPWIKYRVNNLTWGLKTAADMGNSHNGFSAKFTANYDTKLNQQLSAGLGAFAVYGNDNFMEEYFQVTGAEVKANRPQYTPGAGFHKIGAKTHLDYFIDNHNFIRGDVIISKLTGDAAASPITKEDTLTKAFISYGYRF